MGRFTVGGDQGFDRIAIEHRKDADVAFGIFVAGVEPELIELVWRGVSGIEPDVSAFGFSEFRAVGLLDQRTCQTKGLSSRFASDQFGTCRDVAPLVRSAQLQFAVFMLVEIQKIGPLYQLIGKFGERHTVAFAVEPLFDRVLGHHVVYRDALSDVPDELQKRKVFHPVVVVDQFGSVRSVRFEVDEVGELFLMPS